MCIPSPPLSAPVASSDSFRHAISWYAAVELTAQFALVVTAHCSCTSSVVCAMTLWPRAVMLHAVTRGFSDGLCMLLEPCFECRWYSCKCSVCNPAETCVADCFILLQWDHMLQTGVEPNLYTYNAKIKTECIVGHFDAAFDTVANMMESQPQPDSTTWQTILAAAHRFQRSDMVERVSCYCKPCACIFINCCHI